MSIGSGAGHLNGVAGIYGEIFSVWFGVQGVGVMV